MASEVNDDGGGTAGPACLLPLPEVASQVASMLFEDLVVGVEV